MVLAIITFLPANREGVPRTLMPDVRVALVVFERSEIVDLIVMVVFARNSL